MTLRWSSSGLAGRLAVALLVVHAGCGGDATAPTPVPSPTPPDPILVAAGDIASCASDGSEATARILDVLFPPGAPAERGMVAALGDNAYLTGSLGDYTACYEPTWGRHRERTRPTPGNHDYLTPGAEGYYTYFGSAAGDSARGYYSYDLGTWHVVVLNSNCEEVGGCGAGSPQERWLRDDLSAHPSRCTLAYWHHPRFSSSAVHGSQPLISDLWRALQHEGVELVLAGHVHNYERFERQDAAGRADAVRGIRQFVVGTGGRETFYEFGRPLPNSEIRETGTYGVLELTLRSGGYTWRFIPAAGAAFTDAGSDVCH